MYGATIQNVEEPVADYSGKFLYGTTTMAKGIGIMYGEAVSPNDPYKQRANSEVAGLVVGNGLTKNGGGSYYVPLITLDPMRGDVDIHPQEAWNVFLDFYSDSFGERH